MQRIFERPKVAYVVLVVAIVGFFALSVVGNSGTDAQNKASGLYTVALVVRAIVRRRRGVAA